MSHSGTELPLERRWENRLHDLKDQIEQCVTLGAKSQAGAIGHWKAQSLADEPYQTIHSVVIGYWNHDETEKKGVSRFAVSDTGATSGSR